MGDTAVLRQSTNHAPGLLGPPPPPPPPPQSLLAMGGGPEGRRVNQRIHLGMEDRGPGPGPVPGLRRFQSRPGTGRVVHIINFERGRNLKNQLLKLAEPFGEITNHLILNKMNEAFIEMSNTEDALAVVDYYSTNPALVMGKPACVHLSQKYKRIKKAVVKPETKPEPKKQETGSVVHLSKLPSYGYTDSALISLAESFGKVNTYILMRVRNQAFIEMERVEDAQDMVKRCEIVPLVFQGKTLKVDLSERYKKLVLRIPNKLIEQKEKNRKRGHSPDRKAGVKEKQKKTETSETTEGDGDGDEGQTTSEDVTADDTVHTSEETDIVTDSCEPELVEEDEEEEEEAATLLETSSSVADDEVLEDNEEEEKDEGEDQTEAQESLSSVASANVAEENRKGASKFSGNIDDFVTLDEIGDEEDSGKGKSAAAKSAEETTKLECTSVEEETEQENEAEPEEEENETCEMPPASVSETAQASVSTAETTPIAALSMDYDLGPYQPNNPVGVDFVVPKTGFYCKLCCLFYTNEDVAKVTHCSTLPHYQKLKKLFNKMAKNSENKN